MTLGEQEPVVACVLDQALAGFDEALLEAGERPRVDPPCCLRLAAAITAI
jgi:hypothetical protein